MNCTTPEGMRKSTFVLCTPTFIYYAYTETIHHPPAVEMNWVVFAFYCWIQVEDSDYAWHAFAHIDGLVQDCSNPSALAMELLQFCAKPSICLSTIVTLHQCQWSNPKGYGYTGWLETTTKLNNARTVSSLLQVMACHLFVPSLHLINTATRYSCK